jgi:signal transduction histidine kinase
LLLIAVAALCTSGLTAEEPTKPLTRAAEIRALPSEVAARARPVELHGVVTFSYPLTNAGFVVQDETAGIYVSRSPADKSADSPVLSPGDLVDIHGVTGPGEFAPIVSYRSVRVVGRAPLPEPVSVPVADLLSGRWDCQRVALRGVPQYVEYKPTDDTKLRMEIAGPGGRLALHCIEGAPEDPARFVDAEVLATGVCFSFFNKRRELVGARLQAHRREDVQILSPPPQAAFDSPELALPALRAFSPEGATYHRRRVTGTVTLSRPGEFFYLQEGARGIRVQSRDRTALAVGDRVEAAGFVEVAQHFGELREAVFRKVGSSESPPPLPATRREIIGTTSGRTANDHDLDGTLVAVEGRLENIELAGKGGPRLFISSEGYVLTATLGADTPREAVSHLVPGSLVRLSGVCLVELASIWPARDYPQPVNFSLLLRSPADVAVLSAPSWWTTRRLLTTLGLIGGALLLALVWGELLRRQVAQKTTQLAGEIRARSEAAGAFAATTRERQRLAADLHDTLEQALTALALQLEAAGKFSPTDPERGAQHLRLARQFLARSREDVRRSVWNLRAQGLEGRSLDEALRELAAAAPDTQFRVTTHGAARPVPDFIGSQLLLLAQEAVTNALKHGHPRQIELRLTFSPEALELAIEDDGGGFDPAASPGPDEGHFGLLGMRERLKRLGGTLSVQSAPGQTTSITARLPAQALAESPEGMEPGAA